MFGFEKLKFSERDKEIRFQETYLSNHRIMCVQGNLLALCLYGLFAVLDFFALPSSMNYSFCIRIIEMVVLGTNAFCIYKNLIKLQHINAVMIFVSIIVGSGINGMIYYSQAHELGYSTYYAGLCLVILWMGFYFRGGMLPYFVACFVIIGSYVLIAISVQLIGIETIVNNLYFILSTVFLASLYRYHSEKVHRENFNAFLEVNELKDRLNKQHELIIAQKQELSTLIPKEVKKLVYSKTAQHVEDLKISSDDVFTEKEIEILTLEYKLNAEEMLMIACHKLAMTDDEIHEHYFPTKSVRVIKNHFSKIKNKLGLESRKEIKNHLSTLEKC